jgi:sec-independent protein translocase protein TatB
MIVVFLVVLVVFGPQKLPELARGLGKIMAEFRKASTDFKSAFEEEMREMERAALQAERKKAAEAAAASAAAVEASRPAIAEGAAGAVAPSVEGQAETVGAQEPVIAPVAESVSRSSEEWTEAKPDAAAVTDSQDTLHDHQHPA